VTDYELTETVIGCAIKVHSALGPGVLESPYKECLLFELVSTGLHLRDGIRRIANRFDDSASSAKTSAPSAVKLSS
jgi:GxxExxY protein